MPRPDEPTLQVVDPGVVGALKPNGRPACLLHDGGATMAADVVEGADGLVAAENDEERFTVDVGHEVGAGRRELRRPADHDPVAAEPLAPFEIEEPLVV